MTQQTPSPSANGVGLPAGSPTPGGRRTPTRFRLSRVVPVLSIVGGLVLWQLIAELTPTPIFVPFQSIWEAAAGMIEDGSLWKHLAASGTTFLSGYVLAVVVGICIGVILGISKILRSTFEPWIYALYSIPVVAIAPIFIMAFGIGTPGHIVVVFTLTVFAIVVNTMAGVGTADQQYIDVARAYNGNRIDVVRVVLLPSAVPFILTGMRLGVTRALIGVVVAELFGARAGVGYMILLSQQRFDTASMYVGVIILAASGIISTQLLGLLEKRLATWRSEVHTS